MPVCVIEVGETLEGKNEFKKTLKNNRAGSLPHAEKLSFFLPSQSWAVW